MIDVRKRAFVFVLLLALFVWPVDGIGAATDGGRQGTSQDRPGGLLILHSSACTTAHVAVRHGAEARALGNTRAWIPRASATRVAANLGHLYDLRRPITTDPSHRGATHLSI